MTQQLTEHNFNRIRRGGVAFIELEDGDVLAHGHLDPEAVVAAVTEWYHECDPSGAMLSAPSVADVRHGWGVAVGGPPGGNEGPYIRVRGITQWTPNAVPITRIAA